MKYRELQSEYNKRGYDISRRNGVYIICKQGYRAITSVAHAGAVMTPLLKLYSKSKCDNIDSVIDDMDRYINEVIQQDIELSQDNE